MYSTEPTIKRLWLVAYCTFSTPPFTVQLLGFFFTFLQIFPLLMPKWGKNTNELGILSVCTNVPDDQMHPLRHDFNE